MRIYLIGMPGSGKTKIGKELSKILNYKNYDIDNEIIKNYNLSINEIFNKYGEEEFRKIETKYLKDSLEYNNIIISTGGGTILNENNHKYFKGIIIYLNSNINTLKDRLKKDQVIRPLLKTKKIEKIYEERKDIYKQYSNIEIDSNKDINDIIYEILRKIKKNILVINGPNLNMLGQRDKNVYGSITLEEINKNMTKIEPLFNLTFIQTNHEGEIVDILNKYYKYHGIIINPAAFTHYSIAIRDALEIIKIPKVEVHLSDINNREDFRKINYIKDVCDIQFQNEKENGYYKAINYLINTLYL